MSTTFSYGATQATAHRLLARFGQDITLSRTSRAGAVTVFATRGVVVGAVKHVLGDSGIGIGDDRLLLDHAIAPQPGDRITYNGASRVVVDPVVPLNPAGTVLLYECYARGG